MFTVLGIPEWRFVEKYMTWETYKGLKVLCIDCVKDFIFAENSEHTSFILELLHFDPEFRPNIEEIRSQRKKNPKEMSFTNEISKNNSQILRGINDASQENIIDLKEVDNYLTITLHQLKALTLFQGNCENIIINASYEILLQVPVHAVSDNFKAACSIDINFSQRFQINSEEFKIKYRHEPIIVNIYQSIKANTRKSKETLIGNCEIYIGLLFSSTGNSEKTDNSVYGWYNIMDGSRIVGQILIEISTELPFNKKNYGISVGYQEQGDFTSESIKVINEDLRKLNEMLAGKNIEKENREKV